MTLHTIALVLSSLYLFNGACAQATWAPRCGNATELPARLDALLAEYARGELPAPPVRVVAALDARHAAVDEAAAAMRLLADLRLSWYDERLRWNASSKECNSALVSAERLWLPDIALLNSANNNAGDAPLRARLFANGSVSWVMRLDVTVPIAMDMDQWPSDVHIATFIFGSREYTKDELDLQSGDFEYSTVWEASAWEVLAVRGGLAAAGGGGGGGAGASAGAVAWAVTVRRRAPAHALAAAAALTAAALLLLAAGLLPPRARAPLCACAALAVCMWLVSVAARAQAAARSPRALRAACGVCACAAAAAACAALATRLAARASPPPRALRSLLAAASASALCSLAPHERAGEGEGEGEGESAESGAWAAAARLFDNVTRAALALALLVSLCLYL